MAVKVTFLFFYFQRHSNFAPFRPKNGATGGAGGTWLCDNAIYDEWSLPYKADESSKKKKSFYSQVKYLVEWMDPAKNTKMSGCREGRERRIFRPQKCCCCCCRPLIAQPINIWVKKKEKWNDAALFPSLVSIDSGNRKKDEKLVSTSTPSVGGIRAKPWIHLLR